MLELEWSRELGKRYTKERWHEASFSLQFVCSNFFAKLGYQDNYSKVKAAYCVWSGLR